MTQVCRLSGCAIPVWIEPRTRIAHDFCGRSHAQQASKQGLLGRGKKLNHPRGICHECNLTGCSKQVKFEERTGRVHDFCCKAHASQAIRSGAWPAPKYSRSNPTSHFSKVCLQIDCTNSRFICPDTGREYDFCGRSHAIEVKLTPSRRKSATSAASASASALTGAPALALLSGVPPAASLSSVYPTSKLSSSIFAPDSSFASRSSPWPAAVSLSAPIAATSSAAPHGYIFSASPSSAVSSFGLPIYQQVSLTSSSSSMPAPAAAYPAKPFQSNPQKPQAPLIPQIPPPAVKKADSMSSNYANTSANVSASMKLQPPPPPVAHTKAASFKLGATCSPDDGKAGTATSTAKQVQVQIQAQPQAHVKPSTSAALGAARQEYFTSKALGSDKEEEKKPFKLPVKRSMACFCVVCQDDSADTVLSCGHFCLCYEHAVELDKSTKLCPLCQVTFTHFTKMAGSTSSES